MKILAQDVFVALYEAFTKLQSINPDKDDSVAIECAQKDVELILNTGSQLLEQYVDSRIRIAILRSKK